MAKEKESKSSPADADLSEAELRNKLEEMILNTKMNKYDAVVLARRWVYELRSKNTEDKSIHDLIATAVGDILSTKVNRKTVMELPVLNLAKKQKSSPTSILDNIGKKS